MLTKSLKEASQMTEIKIHEERHLYPEYVQK